MRGVGLAGLPDSSSQSAPATPLPYPPTLGHVTQCPPPAQVVGAPNPVPEWLLEPCWQSVLALKEVADYHALPEDLVSSSKRWREWLEMERPEDEPLPGAWGVGVA